MLWNPFRLTSRRLAKHARRRSGCRTLFSASAEILEQRTLLSAAVEHGILSIVGTERADRIRLGAGPELGDVVAFGVPDVRDGTVFRGVGAVEIDTLGGDDAIQVVPLRLASNPLIASAFLAISAGAGNDTIDVRRSRGFGFVEMDGGGAELCEIRIDGGEGENSAIVTSEPELSWKFAVAPGGIGDCLLHFEARFGSGHDSLVFEPNSPARGGPVQLDLDIDMGGGDDVLDVRLQQSRQITLIEDSSVVSGNFALGAGNDVLGHRPTDQITAFIDASLGAGNDDASFVLSGADVAEFRLRAGDGDDAVSVLLPPIHQPRLIRPGHTRAARIDLLDLGAGNDSSTVDVRGYSQVSVGEFDAGGGDDWTNWVFDIRPELDDRDRIELESFNWGAGNDHANLRLSGYGRVEIGELVAGDGDDALSLEVLPFRFGSEVGTEGNTHEARVQGFCGPTFAGGYEQVEIGEGDGDDHVRFEIVAPPTSVSGSGNDSPWLDMGCAVLNVGEIDAGAGNDDLRLRLRVAAARRLARTSAKADILLLEGDNNLNVEQSGYSNFNFTVELGPGVNTNNMKQIGVAAMRPPDEWDVASDGAAGTLTFAGNGSDRSVLFSDFAVEDKLEADLVFGTPFSLRSAAGRGFAADERPQISVQVTDMTGGPGSQFDLRVREGTAAGQGRVDAADYVLWRNNLGPSGAISVDQIDITVVPGGGDDTIIFSGDFQTAPDSSVLIVLDGGSGDDFIRASFSAVVHGSLLVEAFGGIGNDIVSVSATLEGSPTRENAADPPEAVIRVDGGEGDDHLELLPEVDPDLLDSLFTDFAIDGADGFDTCLANRLVSALNCEEGG